MHIDTVFFCFPNVAYSSEISTLSLSNQNQCKKQLNFLSLQMESIVLWGICTTLNVNSPEIQLETMS